MPSRLNPWHLKPTQAFPKPPSWLFAPLKHSQPHCSHTIVVAAHASPAQAPRAEGCGPARWTPGELCGETLTDEDRVPGGPWGPADRCLAELRLLIGLSLRPSELGDAFDWQTTALGLEPGGGCMICPVLELL